MITIGDLLAKQYPKTAWLCDPYVARRGITFLHGRTSIGKSPITWELARCVDQGLPFLGWPTTQAKVLYLEADTTEPLLQQRLDFLPPPIGNWRLAFLGGYSLDLANPSNMIHGKLRVMQDDYKPELVIWNTLRQFYQAPNIDSDTVPKVYNAMYRAFPEAGHVVVAHDRKQGRNEDELDENEAFSGSAAWRDLATIALHVTTRAHKGNGLGLTIKHTKSQVSELVEPLLAHLAPDGTRLAMLSDWQLKIDTLWHQAPKGSNRAEWVAEKLGVSKRTVYRHLPFLKSSVTSVNVLEIKGEEVKEGSR